MLTDELDKPKTKDEVTIFVDGEAFDEFIAIKLPHGAIGHELIQAVALVLGLVSKEELLLFCEDEEEPIDLKAPIRHDHIHHIHRVHKIEVIVFYMSGHHTKSFRPAVRVQKILDWAVGKHGFKIDPIIAPEMELTIHGETTPLPKNAHIGRYVRHPHHELKLDLIRGVVPNGAAYGNG